MKKILPIMTCFDTNYVVPGMVAFYSLLKHANPSYEYIIHVLHNDITEEQQVEYCRMVETALAHGRPDFGPLECE